MNTIPAKKIVTPKHVWTPLPRVNVDRAKTVGISGKTPFSLQHWIGGRGDLAVTQREVSSLFLSGIVWMGVTRAVVIEWKGRASRIITMLSLFRGIYTQAFLKKQGGILVNSERTMKWSLLPKLASMVKICQIDDGLTTYRKKGTINRLIDERLTIW